MSQVITLLKTVLATLPLFVGKFRFCALQIGVCKWQETDSFLFRQYCCRCAR